MLQVYKVVKRFGGVVALDGVTLGVGQGEYVALVGPNGSGKTTLINVVAGLVKPDAGHVYLEGRDITHLPPHKRARLGVARSYQLPQLFPDSTVYQNALIAASSAAPLHRRPDEEKVREVLESFGLWEVRHRKVAELSEGHRKLLDIALAFFQTPKIFLLDEPTSSVSTAEKYKVMDVVYENLRRVKAAALFVEHDFDIVRSYAHRVVQMENGRIVGEYKPGEI